MFNTFISWPQALLHLKITKEYWIFKYKVTLINYSDQKDNKIPCKIATQFKLIGHILIKGNHVYNKGLAGNTDMQVYGHH